MLTPERTNQFEYLLLEILHFVKLNFSVRDAAICAFFYTAERYDKKEQTIRDMVTRCCCADTNFFYDAIYALFSGDETLFKNKYYTFIPRYLHKRINEICHMFTSSNIMLNEASPEPFCQMMKKIPKSSLEEKRALMNAIKIIMQNMSKT